MRDHYKKLKAAMAALTKADLDDQNAQRFAVTSIGTQYERAARDLASQCRHELSLAVFRAGLAWDTFSATAETLAIDLERAAPGSSEKVIPFLPRASSSEGV